MFTLKKKTQAEIDGEAVNTPMTAREYNEKYAMGADTFWSCDRCMILFEEDDIISELTFKSKHEPRCPRKKKKLFTHTWLVPTKFREETCGCRLMCGDMDWWEKNYHLSPAKQ